MSDHRKPPGNLRGASPIHDWCEWLERERSRSPHGQRGQRSSAPTLANELDEIAALSSAQADAEIDALLRTIAHPVGESTAAEMGDRVMSAWRGEPPIAVKAAPRNEPTRAVGSRRRRTQWMAAAAGVGASLALASVLLMAWLAGTAGPSPDLADHSPGRVTPNGAPPTPNQIVVEEPENEPQEGLGGVDDPLRFPHRLATNELPEETPRVNTPVAPLPPSLPPSSPAIVQKPQPVAPAESPEAKSGWRLVSSANAEAPTWESPLPSNHALADRTFRLLKGAATLVWPNVGEVTIHGPAEFRPDADRLYLRHGELMARVLTPTEN